MDYKLGYSVRDLKEEGISCPTRTYELIKLGRLKVVKNGRKTIITGDSVRALMEAA